MMPKSILVVAATRKEIDPFISILGEPEIVDSNLLRFFYDNSIVDVLITGIGMVATSVYTSKFLSKKQYNFAINAGICGAYNRSLRIGEVVNVLSECLPEIGAEDGENFLSVFDLGFLSVNQFPFIDGKLKATHSKSFSTIENLKKVSGNTVNKTSGNEKSIIELLKRNNSDIETMEGAAFMFAASVYNIPFLQLRSVSNYVEKRNSKAWDIPLAIDSLNKVLCSLILHLTKN